MPSPSFMSAKVTEGFYIPSDSAPSSSASASASERFGFGVDPSFIFSASAAYPPPSLPAHNHLHALHLHKPTTLSDLDLGAFDDSAYAPSYSPNGLHHFGGNAGGAGAGGGGGGGANGTSLLGGSAGAFDDFGYRQQQSSAAMYESLSQRAGVAPPSIATSLPHYLSLAPRTSPSLSSPHDSSAGTTGTAGTDLFGAPIQADSPDNAFGSYSSIGESLPSAPAPASATKRRTASKDRSRATGVGKAPTSATRSRSARRAPTAAYVSSPIPVASPGPTASAGHQLAMSMPAYPNAANGSPWFTQQAFAQARSPADSDRSEMDPSGWRPSSSGSAAVPSSAPVGGSRKKGAGALDDVPEDPSQKHAALLTEKRRKRRESHNAVERRRRDNINDRITELASLLPECLLDQVNAPEGDGDSPNPLSPGLPAPSLHGSPATPSLSQQAAAATAAGKPNKGIILAKSVEYIRYLQQLVDLHSQRNAELESLMRDLHLSPHSSASDLPLSPQHHQQQPDPFAQFGVDAGAWAIKSEDGDEDQMHDDDQ